MARARVLVVDDEQAFLQVLVATVRLLGYEAIGAASAETALDLAQQHEPELVLSDVKLPGMDGVELARSIRANDRLASTPILLMSAYRNPRTSDANGFLPKPFDIDDLEVRIRELLPTT